MAFGDIFKNRSARANDAVVSKGDALGNQDIGGDPYMISNCDGAGLV